MNNLKQKFRVNVKFETSPNESSTEITQNTQANVKFYRAIVSKLLGEKTRLDIEKINYVSTDINNINYVIIQANLSSDTRVNLATSKQFIQVFTQRISKDFNSAVQIIWEELEILENA